MPRSKPKERASTRDDLIKRVQDEATKKRLEYKPTPPPAAADEMWLMNGPETTAQGRWALASAKKRKKNARKIEAPI
jgi:hypothetical protein